MDIHIVIVIILTIMCIIIAGWIIKMNSSLFLNPTPVKKVIYCIWTGNNKMTKNRLEGIDTLKRTSGVNVKIVSTQNINQYILKDYPLPPSYPYLSRIHKSDYLRCYLMHHYGGGYSDIKRNQGSWVSQFNRINRDPNIWLIGSGGFKPPQIAVDIAYPEEYNDIQRKHLADYHNRLVGPGFMICRPRSRFTQEWYDSLHTRLDGFYLELKQHPARFTRESHDRPPSHWYRDEKDPKLKKLGCPKKPTKYPVNWNRILGQIFFPLQVKYINHVKTGLPMPQLDNYN